MGPAWSPPLLCTPYSWPRGWAETRTGGAWHGFPPGRTRPSSSSLPPSFLFCVQGKKVPAGPAPDSSEELGAGDEWVFDKKVSEAGGGLFACRQFLSMWYPRSGEVSMKALHLASRVPAPGRVSTGPSGPRQTCSHPPHPRKSSGLGGSPALVFLSPP